VTLDANYQLTPEDALTLSQHDVVSFVDATVTPVRPRAYALALPAYEFEVNAELSPGAAANLAGGCDALRSLVSHPRGDTQQ